VSELVGWFISLAGGYWPAQALFFGLADMNKIEEYKQEKDGLDILHDLPRYVAEGWEAITDGDKERLKWAGVFFRRQTPGRFPTAS